MEQTAKPIRRRYTAEERTKYVELFHQSGLTQRAFARQHGFHAVTLRQWLRRSEEQHDGWANGRPLFKEFALSSSNAGWSAEIALSAGMTIRLGAPATSELLAPFIKRLSQAC